MAHHRKYSRPVNFVLPNTSQYDNQKKQSKEDFRIKPDSSSGEEIKTFYEELVSEPLTADHAKNEYSFSVSKCKRRKYKKESPSKQTSKARKFDRTRAENRLFRYAQEGDLKEFSKQYQLLEDMGVDVGNVKDSFGWTLLMCASHAGHEDIVEYILRTGVDTSFCNKKGDTAKDLALKSNHTDIALLLDKGAPSSHFETDPARVETFYCKECEKEFTDTTESKHKTSIIHRFNINKQNKLSTMYHLPENNVGFQMMVKGGWNKDTGLGSEGQGQKFPVKTVLKRDRLGLGSKTDDKAKVTHFGAKDTSAIQKAKNNNAVRERTMRQGTASRKARLKKERKDRAWERNLRHYMSHDF